MRISLSEGRLRPFHPAIQKGLSGYETLGARARETIEKHFDLNRDSLPRQIKLLESMFRKGNDKVSRKPVQAVAVN